jgi:6-phosphogluconolactonase (cycloisomerase 2 family)
MAQEQDMHQFRIDRRAFGTLLAGTMAAPRLAWAETVSGKAFFYASVGPELALYHIDVENASLARQGSVVLPAMVQYAWPHPTAPVFYVASSNGGPGSSGGVGDTHHLTAFHIDRGSGALSPHARPPGGPSVPLRSRPIHMSVDKSGRYALIAYNRPSAVSVHRLRDDGTIGEEVKQAATLDTGIYAHQIRVTPDNAAAILVTRGNDAQKDKPEDPGALKVFAFKDGQLTNRASIAPGGGLGFGPRHLDFHPALPLVYVSLERQNKLSVFELENGTLAPEPIFMHDTLAEAGQLRPHQLAGTLHIHPSADYLYLANRSDATSEFQGQAVDGGGENNIAVFEFARRTGAPWTGEPRLIQNIETHGFHPRTFALDPSGRMLVVANLTARAVRDGERVQPATLSCYRIGDDGRLAFVRSYDIETGGKLQFWSGVVAVA